MNERLVSRRSGRTDAGAPTLVLLHGLTDSGRMWPDAVDRWAGTYRIVAIDALGHGESDRFSAEELAGDDPIEIMVAETIAVIETLGDRPIVIGHSMGGGVAAVIAARRADLVRGAVLEDPTWHEVHAGADPERGAQWVRETAPARADEAAALAETLRNPPNWVRAEYELAPWSMARVDPAFLALGRAEVRQPWLEIAGAIEVPTLLVTGTDDVIVNPGRRDEIAGLGNASIEVAVIEGAGHCVRRERPDGFYAVVDAWLAAH